MKQLVLIGLMGAGKTTVGHACADKLGRDFVDPDDIVIKLAGGMTVDEIFATGGEPHFRALEKQAVTDVCASTAPLVIACGGGTVLDAENRKRLQRAGTIVWLQAPVEVLAARVGDGATRPLLRDDPAGALTRLAALREVAYDAAADVTVDTSDRSVDDVAVAVIAAFEERAS
jgi:shikimate kinase